MVWKVVKCFVSCDVVHNVLLGLVTVMSKKILRKFLVEKNEKGQQFLAFIKASFQRYRPIFIGRIAKNS